MSYLQRAASAAIVLGLVVPAGKAEALGGNTCLTAVELNVAIPTFACNETWFFDDPVGVDTATASGFASASCLSDSTDNDRWYKYTNGTAATVYLHVSTDDLVNDGADSQIAIFRDCAGVELACSDDDGSISNLLAVAGAVAVPPGGSVRIQFDGYNGDVFARGLFLCSRSLGASDTCAAALDLATAVSLTCDGVFRTYAGLDMPNATPSGMDSPGCWLDGVENDRWFRWTNTGTSTAVLEVSTDMAANVGGDPQIAIFGDCRREGATELACVDDNGVIDIRLEHTEAGVPPGATAYAMIDGYFGDDLFDRAQFRCSGLTSPGDTCALARDLAAVPGFACDGNWHVDEPLGMATAYPSGAPPASCYTEGVDNDRWYKYTNASPAPVVLEVSTDDPVNAGGDSQLAMFNNCAQTTELACDDDSGMGDLSVLPGVRIASGVTVRVQFDGYRGDTGFERGRFRCSSNASPGQACSSALDLLTIAPGFLCDGNVHNAEPLGMAAGRPSGETPASCFADGVQNDRWYRWTNGTGFPVVLRVSTDDPVNVGGDSQIALFVSCLAAAERACADDGGLVDPRLSDTGLVVIDQNQTVYMQFDGVAGSTAFDRALVQCQTLDGPGQRCVNAIDVATAIPTFACDNTWHPAEPLDMAGALPSGVRTPTCFGDGVDADRWYTWTNGSPDPVWFEASTDDPANVGSDTQLAVYRDCLWFEEIACSDDDGTVDPLLSVSGDVIVGPGQSALVQLDGVGGDRSFDRALFRCRSAVCTAPTGEVGNVVLAVADPVDDVVLSWAGATVTPPNHVVYRTLLKAELDETPTGIGDELAVGRFTGLTATVTDVVEPVTFFKVLPADNCGQTVFP